MLFMMTSRAHSCGYVAIMVYYCYVVHQSEICKFQGSHAILNGVLRY